MALKLTLFESFRVLKTYHTIWAFRVLIISFCESFIGPKNIKIEKKEIRKNFQKK
jgi:hypothetical protein